MPQISPMSWLTIIFSLILIFYFFLILSFLYTPVTTKIKFFLSPKTFKW